MRAALRYGIVVALAGYFCTTAGAMSRTEWSVQKPAVLAPVESADDSMLESLRNDVNRHPDDFVTFTTKAEASHFLEQHAADARYETQQRMRELGVMGYWQGRTVVVLPLVTRRTRSGLPPLR